MKQALLYILFTLLLIPVDLSAQQIGKWRTHLSYHNATQSEPAGDLIYAVANGGLFSFDKEDTEVRTYDKVNSLSDTEIAAIKYNNINKTLVIVYENGNIDLLVNDTEVYNLPDLKNKQLPYGKKVNQIHFDNQLACLSTAFGIVIVDVDKKEIVNTYVLNKEINACTTIENMIYAASAEGLYKGNLKDNLLDINNWEKVSNDVFMHIHYFDGNLIGNISKEGFYLINREDYSINRIVYGNYTFANQYNGKLLAGNTDVVLIFHKTHEYTYKPLKQYVNHLRHLSLAGNTYWGSYGKHGLIGQKLNKESDFEDKTSPIIPDSPVRNLPYYLRFSGERLLITGGGINWNRLNTPGTIMMMENNTWKSFQEEGIREQTNLNYKDITSIAQNPKDPGHHFASSAGEGLYEFKEGKFIKLYNLSNSPLESALPNNSDKDNYIRINGLNYDKNNNLWMLNSEAEHSVHVLKEDGNWVSFHFPETTRFTNFEHTLFDRRGWLWATSMFGNNSGIFCLNTNNTLDNLSDDQCKFIEQFVNQDGNLVERSNIHCITEDKNGAIWVGTEKGPIVFNNPSRFFDANFQCTQIKIPRNDGSNLADYLLADNIITTITVDGANRKWIGTEKNGLYLISEDGLETIHHFTEENSPLFSNSIRSVAIHPNTGEVFIGTTKGLISYQSDAVEGEENFSEHVYAYPNPVRPGYTGLITIKGLARDSDIKIIHVNGSLIHSGTSNGGMFTWDGKNRNGKRVASGVYYVLAADPEGKEGVVTKIVVIK